MGEIIHPVPGDVDVDNIVLNRMREQVASQKGFNQLNLVAAANYFLNKNSNLEEALGWSQRAAGFKSYTTLRTLATAYEKLNRLKEADSVMTEALTMAAVAQHIGYGRALITQKRNDKAVEIMMAGKTKFGDVFAVNNGLMFAYAAKADYKNAIAAAEKAMTQAPNDAAKKALEGQIAKLKEGKDINSVTIIKTTNMNNAISWFEIGTTDLDRATKFYETIFGISFTAMDMPHIKMRMFPLNDMMTQVGGALVDSGGFHKPSGTDGPLIYLNGNPDVQTVLDKVEAAGGKIMVPKTEISPEYGYMAVIIDTEGNRIGLHSVPK